MLTSEMRQTMTDPIIKAMTLLDRWHMTVSSTGALWIRCRRFDVTFQDLCVLLKRIGGSLKSGDLRYVVLDISGSAITRRHRSVTVQLIQELARQMAAVCRQLPRCIEKEFLNTDMSAMAMNEESSLSLPVLDHDDSTPRPTCFVIQRCGAKTESAGEN